MSQRTIRALTLVCGVALALAAAPTQSRAGCRLIDCLFGTAPSAPSATTYAPAYVPSPVYAAPASCAPCSSPCSLPCAPQTCDYMPAASVVAYRPYYAYAPVVATAYQPVVGSYAVTTYRPFLGTYQTRLVPYATYRPYYAYSPVVSYAYSPVYSPCASCNSCASYSPCGSCGLSGCGSAIYGAPSSGCSSCNVASSSAVTPSTDINTNGSVPRTFEEKANKPTADKELDPIPAGEVKSSSLSLPSSPDVKDRTTSRPLTTAVRVQAVAQPVKPAPIEDDGEWYVPKE
jgi:hypothetical protein